MNFRATEYLKGSGPTTFAVELRAVGNEQYWENNQRYNGYLTRAKALEVAQGLVNARNAAYDNLPGVLFLEGPVTAASNGGGASGASGSTSSYNFTLFNTLAQGSFKVDVDSMSRAWLPAQGENGGASGESDETASNPTLITNRPPPGELPGVSASTDPNT
jgi:hypothetical protein